MTERCNKCGEKITLEVAGFIQHGSCSRGCCSKNYKAKVVISCDCNSESAKSTELTSINFHGEVPEEWA